MEKENLLSTLKFRGFWSRLLASFLDCLVLYILFIPIGILFYYSKFSIFLLSVNVGIYFDYLLMGYILPGFAIVCFWQFKQATPGKMIIKAVLVDAETGNKPSLGKLIVRYLGYALSALPFGLGFIWIAFDSRKQGWHDKLANTLVVSKKCIPEYSLERASGFPVYATVLETKVFRAVFVFSCLLMIIGVPYSFKLLFVDDQLLPDAKAWMEPEKQTCSRKDNGYYYLTGSLAPEGEDPYRVGMELVDSYVKFSAAHGVLDNDTPFEFDQAKFKFNIEDDVKNICDPAKTECLPEYLKHEKSIDEMKSKNRELLERYDNFYSYTCFQTIGRPHPARPLPSGAVIMQGNKLLLSAIAIEYSRGDKEKAMSELGKDISRQRRTMAQGDDLIYKMIPLTLLTRDIRLYSELLDVYKELPATIDDLGKTIRPLSVSERSFRKSFKMNYQMMMPYLLMFSSDFVIDKYIKGDKDSGDLIREIPNEAISEKMSFLFKKNATQNSYYKMNRFLAEVSELDASSFIKVKEEIKTFSPTYIDYAHNLVGSIFLGVEGSNYSQYFFAMHDLDGLINLVQLKRLIREKNIQSSQVEAFLKNMKNEYADPYTGEPVKWNPEKQLIYFKGMCDSKPWLSSVSVPFE